MIAKETNAPANKEHIPVMMSIAGWDSCGGAGVLADMRVAEAVGCYGTAVVTAITAQNTVGVSSVWPLRRAQVREQGYTLLGDILPDAVKVGMLGDEEAANGVKDVLLRYLEIKNLSGNEKKSNIVVDTIIKSTSGAKLFDASGIGPMLEIIKLARVITPNLPEAQSIGKNSANSIETPANNNNLASNNIENPARNNKTVSNNIESRNNDYEQWARALSEETGGASVYLKGGHGDGNTITDIFFNAETGEILHFAHPRIATRNTHGTGCTLSSAIAGFLAQGLTLNEAASSASHFVFQSLKDGASLRLGHGHGPTYFGHSFSNFGPTSTYFGPTRSL